MPKTDAPGACFGRVGMVCAHRGSDPYTDQEPDTPFAKEARLAMDPRIVRKKLELIEQLAVAESRPVEGWEVRTGLQLPAGDYQWLTAWEPVPLAD